MPDRRPVIAVTMGDPTGVGPEIIAGAWADPALHRHCRPLVIGRPEVLRRAVTLRRTSAEVRVIESPDQAEPTPGCIPCLSRGSDDSIDIVPGTLDGRAGQAAYEAVVAAARLALDGTIDAITTAPLHKESLHLAGHPYPGHTELLAELCATDDFAMMLYLGPEPGVGPAGGLAVVHVTLHTAMRNVFELITEDHILAKARLADRFMTGLTGSRPRIVALALNPHGGEGGLFGTEEQTIIAPAVQRGAHEGLLLEGPLPSDTAMVAARDGRFDAVVAMYHDQGHIALKLLGMHRAVNVTLGLPIIRTSVAHGTAGDIAWKGCAKTSSLVEAVRVAGRLAIRG